ncbi:MAG: polyprenol monophosphomannose synthase [Candidatus Sungbacteria bacterium]|uniref:Polyprenol monophosphomannose synthase n=1 Tax=Candidatus Sungiibacteriota bacterium TaxID=2750080 RepID=A0A932DSE7_9BACT|nr:polyprenol monophosphomannose synthase [Candidatus Sungbacteria bacterium]MBI2465794.1 polyprenol monophosphomannose synthase [Candidatus Sungbacteria bacterium]
MQPKVAVVIPTYNEKENLPVLVEKIFNLNVPGLEILVVDDNSPDGTAMVARGLSKKYPVRVMVRDQKRGLGTAYAAGFKLILNQPDKPDFIIQMDADLSHNPAEISVFLNKIKTCDVVLGSRYIKGGGVVNWNFLRRLVSRLSNIYARLILGIPVRDLTGGFKCWKREVLEKINLERLDSVGYNFQIETTYKALQAGFRVSEVPIVFTERKFGSSKFNLGIIAESFIKVLLLKLK